MTKILVQATALALSAVVTFGVFAGADGIATHQYAAADALVLVQATRMQTVALQTRVVTARRNANV